MSRPRSPAPGRDRSVELSDLDRIHNEQLRDPAQIVAHWSKQVTSTPGFSTTMYKASGGIYSPRAASLSLLRGNTNISSWLSRLAAGFLISRFLIHQDWSSIATDWLCTLLRHAIRIRFLIWCRLQASVNRSDDLVTQTENELIPIRSRFLPGCLYIHDLAMVTDKLHCNAVGENAVLRLDDDGGVERVWWPRCIDTENGPIFGRNHIQLNSIAAGKDLAGSYFSASSSEVMRFRPGHLRFPVDKRGVIFSGSTREPVAWGLTRPHSARLHRDAVWVNNSGYGELGYAEAGGFHPVVQLPGWTRGLCFHGDIAFVGTSRVIPRFQRYAPGLNLQTSICAVHAVDIRTATIRGSLRLEVGQSDLRD